MKINFLLLIFCFSFFFMACHKQDELANEASTNANAGLSITSKNDMVEDVNTVIFRGLCDCDCTITVTSQEFADLEVCGAADGSQDCVDTPTNIACAAITEPLKPLFIDPSGGFCAVNTSSFGITNVGGSIIGLSLNCGGATQNITLGPGATWYGQTGAGCNVTNCN